MFRACVRHSVRRSLWRFFTGGVRVDSLPDVSGASFFVCEFGFWQGCPDCAAGFCWLRGQLIAVYVALSGFVRKILQRKFYRKFT